MNPCVIMCHKTYMGRAFTLAPEFLSSILSFSSSIAYNLKKKTKQNKKELIWAQTCEPNCGLVESIDSSDTNVAAQLYFQSFGL